MGKAAGAALLVAVCLAAAVLAEGGRSHKKFAARTSYQETKQEETKQEEPTKETSGTPVERYVDGYPNTEGKYNPKTGEYEGSAVFGDLPKPRYTNGYYNQADKFSDPTPIPVVKSSSSYYKETSNPTTTTTTAKPEIQYPAGYDSFSKTTHSSSDETSFPPGGRYSRGYYPDSTYAGKTDPVLPTTSKPVSLNTYQGNFDTLPMPTLGVPFVEDGAGCTTSFWAHNPGRWPAFLRPTSTVGDAFGSKATEVYGTTTLMEALEQNDVDPYKQLLKFGCTALINSYNRGKYTISHMKVIEEFNAALISKPAAKAQALVFETANVASISAGNACV